ncbi:hypothetical protein EUX98_g3125 [Antrodiella citrinella]|uniref:P-loop containing nucleoside triphosphate hydrolase protein n=1 Tax=Antrodiella citrinella TaxID=2447956 RepID=A0A4S4MXB8_9APHY|nr:hypothetical protein EUX98_g3125 [Antrodiella citrinella]
MNYLNERWYSLVSRKGRTMDLIGDYAGSELFLIDGHSLLQEILTDDLLALGRDDEASYQILHAIHSLEQLLESFQRRDATFEIAFWEGTEDPSWHEYLRIKKPMFVMLNDGSSFKGPKRTEVVLLQRIFMFNIMSQGVALTLLHGTVFRESKISSLVMEYRQDAKTGMRLPEGLRSAVRTASTVLQNLETKVLSSEGDHSPLPLLSDLHVENPLDLDATLAEVIKICAAQALGPLAPELLFAFVAHSLITPTLSVEERARPMQSIDPKMNSMLKDVFLPRVFAALLKVPRGSAVDIDGRVFSDLLHCVLCNSALSLDDILGADIAARVNSIWSKLSLPEVHISSLVTEFEIPEIPSPVSSPSSLPEPFGVLPFSNPVFDDILEPIDVDIDDEDEDDIQAATHFNFGEQFVDASHWHNHRRAILPKHLGGETPQAMDARQRMKQLRRDQNFKKQLQWQAQTLTGAFGAILEPIVIVPGGDSKEKEAPSTKNHARKPKKEHISSAEKIRRANAEKKQTDADKSNQAWWTQEVASLKKMTTPQKISRLEALLRNERRAGADGWLAVMLRLYDLNLQFMLWLEDPDSDHPVNSAAVRDKYTVAVMSRIKTISERGNLWPSAIGLLKAVLNALGFSQYIPSLLESSPDQTTTDRKLGFDFARLDEFVHITEHRTLWQLRLFGEHMDRSMDSQADSRVSFKPDAWQRQVLDSLDANESVLVVAPTSAGKTFISYYAMEKVLRSSDNDILVYIAPTKALVTQIAAEVYGRFTKNFTTSRSCWAIHTRDYRINDPSNCQILVTVPEILATLLLSPAMAREWIPRIKWIILDEIHSIGEQGGGAVWEQIILLAPCPVIGLSATIGHPEKFNNWLESVQVQHGFKHNFIVHPHRYSHLRKFVYVPQSRSKAVVFPGLERYVPSQQVRFLHPVSLLTSGGRTLPPDFALESRDCLTLYNALYELQSELLIDVTDLKPAKFFKKSELLRQKDILSYEAQLKDVLIKLMEQSDPRDPASPIQKIVSKMQDEVVATYDTVPDDNVFLDNIVYMLSDLHASGDLPTLLFQFDRTGCEVMAIHLLRTLEDNERKWRENSPEWTTKIRKWERWQAGAKARQRLSEKAAKKQKGEKEEDAPRAEPASTWEETFNPDDPSSEFSFVGKSTYTMTDLENALNEMAWVSIPQWALDALRRGIAVHHAGMNKAYRSLVESLYRLGFVRVIICTGTLALGINAPTKTSVFCGDSPYLTALMYRQCAGRAGRRGFDLLGKVVFYGLAMDRIQRLVLSRLPSLGGNFPMTSTMVLRLFNLLEGSNNSPFAETAIRNMLQLPNITFTSDIGRDQLLHHTRFSIDYLRRAALLDAQGHPIDLFGVAAHLYYTEPSNLALISLLRHGIIHRICNQTSMINAQREFMLVMCHLFGRRYLPSVYASTANVKELIRKSPSMVVLPPLPEDARKVLLKHDGEILRVFSGYALKYASQHGDTDDEHKLPVSGKTYPRFDETQGSNIFRSFLQSSAVQPVARSPFVANSGHGDNFASVPELTRTARRGLHLNDHAIPSLHHITALPGDALAPFPLNAYLLDYYIHGQKKALVNVNGIREGDLWFLLEDFTLCLKAIRSSLEKLLLGVADGDEDVDDDPVDPAESDNTGRKKPGMGGAEKRDMSAGINATPIVQTAVGANDPPRPPGMSDENWKVLLVIHRVTFEFEEKFREMWA